MKAALNLKKPLFWICLGLIILIIGILMIVALSGGKFSQKCISEHSQVSMEIDSIDTENKIINVKWHNDSQETIVPKNGCTVYKEVDGEWELLDATPAFLIAVYISPGEVYDEIYRVSHIDMSEPGKYKIETEFSMGDNSYKMNVEFNLKEGM